MMRRERQSLVQRGSVTTLNPLGDPSAEFIILLNDDCAAAAPAPPFPPAPLATVAIPAAFTPIIVPAVVTGIYAHAAWANLDTLRSGSRCIKRSSRQGG
jgi:hypothetical protein